MTDSSSPIRKPPDWQNGSTSYASLHAPDTGSGAPKPSAGDAPARPTAPNDFAVEADKLRQLREALWAAFEAGPEAGLPNTLIDLTIAYTNALRLQLNLRSVSSRHAKPKPQPCPPHNREAGVKTS